MYRSHFTSLWSGSNISAIPLLVLNNKWIVTATSCEIWDREQHAINDFNEKLTNIPPTYNLSHNYKGEKIYDIQCYPSPGDPSKGIMFDSFTEGQLNDNNYELPLKGVLKIDARKK